MISAGVVAASGANLRRLRQRHRPLRPCRPKPDLRTHRRSVSQSGPDTTDRAADRRLAVTALDLKLMTGRLCCAAAAARAWKTSVAAGSLTSDFGQHPACPQCGGRRTLHTAHIVPQSRTRDVRTPCRRAAPHACAPASPSQPELLARGLRCIVPLLRTGSDTARRRRTLRLLTTAIREVNEYADVTVIPVELTGTECSVLLAWLAEPRPLPTSTSSQLGRSSTNRAVAPGATAIRRASQHRRARL
jgi:hypothetical protein